MDKKKTFLTQLAPQFMILKNVFCDYYNYFTDLKLFKKYPLEEREGFVNRSLLYKNLHEIENILKSPILNVKMESFSTNKHQLMITAIPSDNIDNDIKAFILLWKRIMMENRKLPADPFKLDSNDDLENFYLNVNNIFWKEMNEYSFQAIEDKEYLQYRKKIISDFFPKKNRISKSIHNEEIINCIDSIDHFQNGIYLINQNWFAIHTFIKFKDFYLMIQSKYNYDESEYLV